MGATEDAAMRRLAAAAHHEPNPRQQPDGQACSGAGQPSNVGHRISVPMRVRFSETDAMGVANHGAYLAWFEVGRIEYLRDIGHSYADVHSGGMDMVVVEARVSYLRPLAFDTSFTVECDCVEIRGATFTFGYELRDDEGVCTTGETRHACVDRERMRAVRVPEWLIRSVRESGAR